MEGLVIMVVDDNVCNLSILIRRLSKSGFTVISASNGRDAIQKSIEQLPDLILMDIRMPVMNGIEAAEAIKSDPLTCNIPIIGCSAHLGTFSLEDQHRVFNYTIPKPVSAASLSEQVSELLAA